MRPRLDLLDSYKGGKETVRLFDGRHQIVPCSMSHFLVMMIFMPVIVAIILMVGQ